MSWQVVQSRGTNPPPPQSPIGNHKGFVESVPPPQSCCIPGLGRCGLVYQFHVHKFFFAKKREFEITVQCIRAREFLKDPGGPAVRPEKKVLVGKKLLAGSWGSEGWVLLAARLAPENRQKAQIQLGYLLDPKL